MTQNPNLPGAPKQNPERIMLLLFPAITLALFVVGALLWWVINTYLVPA